MGKGAADLFINFFSCCLSGSLTRASWINSIFDTLFNQTRV